MIDPARLRKQVIWDLLSAPWTVIPLVGGASLLLIAWALDRGAALWTFLGLAGVLTGIGAMATQWLLGGEKLVRRAFERMLAQAQQQEAQRLDELDRRLEQDEDPRPEKSLRRLRALYETFKNDASWTSAVSGASAAEIAGQVEKLFKACIISVERSAELWEASCKMATAEGRRSVIEARERVVSEIQQSVQQLARTLDSIQALRIQQRGADHNLAQIRQELSDSLDVARRVEERMQSLDAELGGAAVRANRESAEG